MLYTKIRKGGTKMRLRRWVKVTLVVIASALMIIGFTKWTNKEIDNCVKGGNTIQFCNSIK